jgi:hypothetical protein
MEGPGSGRRDVKRLNIVGDEQADKVGHGGERRTVLVYQIDSYQYWAASFSRDGFTYGQFGENFTVMGLVDSEVHIGDRYLVGTAVFEVTHATGDVLSRRHPNGGAYDGGIACGPPRDGPLERAPSPSPEFFAGAKIAPDRVRGVSDTR